MSNFIIKESPMKVDPKTPESHPDYKKSVNAGRRAMAAGDLTFNDRGDEERYWKAVKSNPNNVPGLPAFYPPLKLPKISGFGDGNPTEELPCGHRWVHKRYEPTKMFRCAYGHEYDEVMNKISDINS